MRSISRIFVGMLFAAALAFGQSRQGPFTINASTSPCAKIQVTGNSTVAIQVTGTFSATLQPEVVVTPSDGSTGTPANTQVTPSTSSTAQSTITATGTYKSAVGGYDTFLVCVSSYVSGTATIYLTATPAINASLFGQGAPGSVSSVFTRTGAVTAQSGDYTVGQVTGAAPLASPTFTGVPAAPTAAPLANSTQLATTAYADAAVAAGGVLKASVTLTPTQIKAMKNTFATAVQVIPAPGAGNIIDPIHVTVNLQFATTPYATSSGTLQLNYTDGVTLFNFLGSFFSSAAITASNSQFQGLSLGAALNASNAISVNQALVVNLNSATSYTAGDSPIVLTFYYRIIAAQ